MKSIYVKGIGIALMALIILLFIGTSLITKPNEPTFQLFFTSDVYGYLKPCG